MNFAHGRTVAGTVALVAALGAGCAFDPEGPGAIGEDLTATAPYRAFSASSYWNTPLPVNAPIDAHSSEMIAWLKGDNAANYVRLAGAGSTGEWGRPIYWAQSTDPTYRVAATGFSLPPEFGTLHIPSGARPDPSSDSELTVYDLDRGYVVSLWRAAYNATRSTWSAGGGEVHYLASNGLDGSLRESDDRRNRGHRGVPAAVTGVRWDEYRAGVIPHVLELFVNTTRCQHVFPMVGDECGTTATYAPPEGTRVRIRASVDLSRLNLSPAARIIATALQTYGAVIGDQSGASVECKIENTVAEGRGQLWSGVLTTTSLSAIPLDDFEVISLGYGQ
jgi:hypothetical protein